MKKTVTLEQHDLDSLHDTVLEAIELDLDNEQLIEIRIVYNDTTYNPN